MSFMRGLRTVGSTAVVCLVFLVYAPFTHAQSTSASVSGAIADAQGGVLPGVTVTLTSRSQGTAMTATTDDQGRFVFQIVRPDTYTLQATLQGFKTLQRSNVVVNAADNDTVDATVMMESAAVRLEGMTITDRRTRRDQENILGMTFARLMGIDVDAKRRELAPLVAE